MRIKWNWGTKLTIAIILFMSFILVLVYFTTQHRIILVEKDYYPKGLAYQKRIESIKNAKKFRDLVKIRIDKKNVNVYIPNTLPDSGSITFYRPDQEKSEDVVLKLKKGKSLNYSYPVKKLRKGIYVLKINWYEGGEGYFIEEKIFLNK